MTKVKPSANSEQDNTGQDVGQAWLNNQLDGAITEGIEQARVDEALAGTLARYMEQGLEKISEVSTQTTGSDVWFKFDNLGATNPGVKAQFQLSSNRRTTDTITVTKDKKIIITDNLDNVTTTHTSSFQALSAVTRTATLRGNIRPAS